MKILNHRQLIQLAALEIEFFQDGDCMKYQISGWRPWQAQPNHAASGTPALELSNSMRSFLIHTQTHHALQPKKQYISYGLHCLDAYLQLLYISERICNS